jgi:hypothetical protein
LINFPTPFSHNFYKIKWENPGIYKILGPESGKKQASGAILQNKMGKSWEKTKIYKINWEKLRKKQRSTK